MLKSLLTTIAILVGLSAMAQKSPVSWKFESKKTGNGTYELYLTASVSSPWHIYSQNTPAGGPLPTKIQFKPNPLVSLSGAAAEQGDVKKVHDKSFGVDVIYFVGDAGFTQIVKLKATVKTSLQGSVEYMVCNDHQCLPPVDVPFNIILN